MGRLRKKIMSTFATRSKKKWKSGSQTAQGSMIRCKQIRLCSFKGGMFTITVSKISETEKDYEPRIVKSKGYIQQYPDYDKEEWDL